MSSEGLYFHEADSTPKRDWLIWSKDNVCGNPK